MKDGESAGARTQDQRLKRAMLYQLSYALKPHIQVSTFEGAKLRESGGITNAVPDVLYNESDQTK
jgi:hypothetical protein